jgi:hypothetical protein
MLSINLRDVTAQSNEVKRDPLRECTYQIFIIRSPLDRNSEGKCCEKESYQKHGREGGEHTLEFSLEGVIPACPPSRSGF